MKNQRLNKFIAHCGYCSRRKADELIAGGKVKVNGKVVTELGTKVDEKDQIRVEGKRIQMENFSYFLFNKPKNVLCTLDDPQGRTTIKKYTNQMSQNRIFPVGRLDRNSSGLILLTNDGDLANFLMHPASNVKKVYQVTIDRPIDKKDFDQLFKGVELEDGIAKADEIYLDVNGGGQVLEMTLHSGKNRVIRRMLKTLGYNVDKLDRIVYSVWKKEKLQRGHWRVIHNEEIENLKANHKLYRKLTNKKKG